MFHKQVSPFFQIKPEALAANPARLLVPVL